MNPILLTDYYKTEHFKMYPENTSLIYSNFTPRKSRIKGVDSVVVFGIQYFIEKYLIELFNKEFFTKSWEEVKKEYEFAINTSTSHIQELHSLGYLPIKIKALPEGTMCPIRIPCMTVVNTDERFYWLTNYLETLISTTLWQPITSATIAFQYKKLLSKYAKETTGSDDFVQWQAHDFSMRGMSSVESAILSGMGHLTSFTGTDTIPAIYALRDLYKGEGLIGASVPATEHSVMCMGTKNDEVGTFSRLLDAYPTGILSVVSDTWDLWKVLTEYLPILEEKILARDGKLVIRPDSGDPVDIICGTVRVVRRLNEDKGVKVIYNGQYYDDVEPSHPKYGCNHQLTTDIKPYEKGVIELLWDIFGGTINEQGYKVLDPHIGAIYGDSITLERAEQICERLKAKGFASTNIVFGVGSYTYQYNTRDTFGFAMKATYGEVIESFQKGTTPENLRWVEEPVGREIYKDPITDDGTKKSLKGLIHLWSDSEGVIHVKDQCSKKEEEFSLLETVFENGKLVKTQTLEEIRKRIKQYL